MNMKKKLILLCCLLGGFTLHSTKINAQAVTNDQKLIYPYPFAPSEGLVNKTEKEHRQEICLNGYWDFQPVRLPKEYVQGKGIAPELGISMLLLTVTWKAPTIATTLHILKNGNR